MSTLTAPALSAEPASAQLPGWTILYIDGLLLGLPQREVRMIELVANLKPSAGNAQASMPVSTEAREIGWLVHNDGRTPVYCLDRELQLQRPAPEARRMCVVVGVAGDTVGVACDRVQLLATDAELTAEPVPGCMTGTPSPITAFAWHAAGLTAVSDAASLAAYFAFLRHPERGAHE